MPNMKKYGTLLYEFYTQFDLENFRNKDAYHFKVAKLVSKFSYYYANLEVMMMLFGMFLYNALPAYHNYQVGAFSGKPAENATLEFSIYYIFFTFRQENNFWAASFLNIYFSYGASVMFCIMDLMLSFMVFHIIGHIKILIYKLENMQMPKSQHVVEGLDMQFRVTVELYSKEENEIIKRNIKDCISHHKRIVQFTDDLSSFFGPMLASTLLFHLISCCLLLLECTQQDPDALVQYGPLTLIIFAQLIQISLIFEFLRAESEKLPDKVYSTPWECMNISNQRSLCIFLQRVQTPVEVVALGLTKVGVQTMTGILKTTYSYFTFLRTMT